MDIPLVLQLFVLLLITKGIASNNTPPLSSFSTTWHVREDDPLGTVIQTLKARDSEGDHVTFSLESRLPGENIHTYFRIDKHERVRVAKPLTGLAGEGSTSYILRVRMSDGKIPSVVEVRLQVTKDDNTETNNGGRMSAGRPGGWGNFGGGGPFGRVPPPGGFVGATLPAFFNVTNPGSGGLGYNAGSNSIAPPQIVINHRQWKINADAAVGTIVEHIRINDISGYGYNLTLQGSKGLLKIHHSGIVRVAAPLTDQVGDLTIMVIASNGHSESSEPVVFRVFSRPTPPTTTTTITTSSITTSTRIITVPSPVTPKPKSNDKGNNSQDLRVIGNSAGGSGITGSSTGITTDPPKEAPETDISLTIIPIVLVLGISPIALALFFYWRRIQRRKTRAEAKESAVVYSEKGEEATATQVIPRRNAANNNQERKKSRISFAALYRKRAQSNKYEDDLKAGGEDTKRKLSEVSVLDGDNWEFARHHLKFMGILGEGCFGQVWKCEALGLQGKGSMLVAVKTVKESAGERERKDLVQELKVLKNLGSHINVVSLLGCCTEKDPIFIILEYMIGGKLQSFLRASRADTNYGNLHGSSSSITPRDLTLFTYQIARGMEFLARNGIIHRDLAARNVLVGEDKICKVADFGFARDIANNRVYERKSDGRLPIRWMAPESLFDNIFTTKSDVWSFGVLLWEIVTLGSTPYPGLGASEVMKKVKDGYRLEKPDHCRREVYNIMYYCWDKDAKERPSFTELVHTLESLLLSEVDYIELDRFPDHSYYNVITAEKADELL